MVTKHKQEKKYLKMQHALFNSSYMFSYFLSYPIYQPLRSGRIWHKVNFKAEFNRFNSEISFS